MTCSHAYVRMRTHAYRTIPYVFRIYSGSCVHIEEQLEATLKELAALRAAVDGPSTALVVWRPQRRA